VLLSIVAVPVLLFWIFTASLPRLIAWLTRDYP
jgi:hypothetical protein